VVALISGADELAANVDAIIATGSGAECPAE